MFFFITINPEYCKCFALLEYMTTKSNKNINYVFFFVRLCKYCAKRAQNDVNIKGLENIDNPIYQRTWCNVNCGLWFSVFGETLLVLYGIQIIEFLSVLYNQSYKQWPQGSTLATKYFEVGNELEKIS